MPCEADCGADRAGQAKGPLWLCRAALSSFRRDSGMPARAEPRVRGL